MIKTLTDSCIIAVLYLMYTIFMYKNKDIYIYYNIEYFIRAREILSIILPCALVLLLFCFFVVDFCMLINHLPSPQKNKKKTTTSSLGSGQIIIYNYIVFISSHH